ncbi:PHB depolymerase family esterase [Halomonas sp. LY9]
MVVLHGSTQSAESYNRGAGWSELADQCGAALLYPEQRRTNNPISSFNWFKSGDSRRDAGEPLSIHHMIERVISEHAIDPARVFITGMSSGGAMTSVMLATYPEVFAGGAIIAGLPYRSADNLMQAAIRMKGYGGPSDHKLDALVREASTFEGPWPTISVWHGGSDSTVATANADSIVRQWQQIHQVEGPPTRVETVEGFLDRCGATIKGVKSSKNTSLKAWGMARPLWPAVMMGLVRKINTCWRLGFLRPARSLASGGL